MISFFSVDQLFVNNYVQYLITSLSDYIGRQRGTTTKRSQHPLCEFVSTRCKSGADAFAQGMNDALSIRGVHGNGNPMGMGFPWESHGNGNYI